jgi:hypothetical protein
MDCFDTNNRSAHRVTLNRYSSLHSEGRRLITGWFNRAWEARDSQAEDYFEAFIFVWFSVNGWAACVTGLDRDAEYISALMRDQSICREFDQLLSVPTSAVTPHASQFSKLWPIFSVKRLRRHGIIRLHSGNRDDIINTYLAAGATIFEPQCWKKHKDAGQQVPVDWPHTLASLYQVRCNLFHGEKAADSEIDQLVVSCAFKVLVNFFKAAGYFER